MKQEGEVEDRRLVAAIAGLLLFTVLLIILFPMLRFERSRADVGAATTASAGPSRTAVRPRAGACGPLDVALVLDTTGSMQPAIDNVRANLALFTEAIEVVSAHDYRIALVEFTSTVTVLVPFSSGNGAVVRDALPRTAGGGGSSASEPWDEALVTTVRGRAAADSPAGVQSGDFSPFRARSKKLVLLVTDAAPSGADDVFGPDDLENADRIARESASDGVLIATVLVTSDTSEADPDARRSLRSVAAVTGSFYSETATGATDLTAGLEQAIATCGSDPAVNAG